MPLSRDDVVHIASLCRVGMTDEDLERMREQLSHILEQFEVLNQVDTAGVAPASHSIELHSVFKEDEARPSLPSSDVLSNAPRQQDGFLRIKAVLEE